MRSTKKFLLAVLISSFVCSCKAQPSPPEPQVDKDSLAPLREEPKAETIQKQQPSIELSRLVSTFLVAKDSDGAIAWSTGAEPTSPITWISSGIVDGTECHVEESFCRTGTAIATVNGKVTHEVLKQTTQPGKWNITLAGSRSGVSAVSIQSDVNSQEIEGDLVPTLSSAEFKPSPVKCLNEPLGDGNVLYSINVPSKKMAWLLSGWSCGSAGCSSTIEIYYNIEDTQNIQCYGDDS